jgi:hypothetical protein
MIRRVLAAGTALCAFASPALADHGGASGLGQGGSSIDALSPDTLDAGQFAAGVRVTITNPDSRSDAELAALAGNHIHAHDTDYNLHAAAGIAYGVSHHLSLSAELPYIRRDHLREGAHSHDGGTAANSVEQLGSVYGTGDVSLLAKYRMTGGSGPGFALVAGIKLPTGQTHRRSPEGERLETEHQLGTGSWDPIIGAAFGTRAGPLRINASALYQFAGKGAQDTRLGDRFKGGIALSHRFGPADHHHGEAPHHHDHDEGAEPHAHAAPHGHASWEGFVELIAEWEGRQSIAGEIEPDSGGKAVWLSPGARVNSASGYSFALSAGIPVWQRIRASHPDNDYRATLSIGHAF